MTKSCLFLKPQVVTEDGRKKQDDDIKNFIQPAIDSADLSVIDNLLDGLEVSDISGDIIKKIYKADILLIDANCYETKGIFLPSPYLYYYMAIGHSLGNATILVANALTYIPPNLIQDHTLVYSRVGLFIKQFEAAVNDIEKLPGKPDNPIQVYRNQAAKDEEIVRLQAEKTELEREIAEKAKAQQKQGKQSFTFRRVNS